MNELTMPTIISVKQFDTIVSAKVERSDMDVREMMELFISTLLGHGYQKGSIDNTICEMADKVREDAKSNRNRWEADFEIDDNEDKFSYIKNIVDKYS